MSDIKEANLTTPQSLLEHIYSKKAFYGNPYKHFYTQYEESILDDTDDDSIELDQFKKTEANVEQVAEHLEEQLKLAAVDKADHVAEAMKYDPAFMLDPIEEYYSKFIPKEVREAVSEDEYQEILSYYDPITWAERNLLRSIKGGFAARVSKKGIPYQSQMIRSKSRRIVVRAGRRIGKTLALVTRILHKAFTWAPGTDNRKNYKIVIFTPNQTQINVIFKMMEMLVDDNPKLMNMLRDNKLPTRRTPITEIEMTNGVTIQGYVSGSTAIRGSAADMLVLDEGSFLTSDDTDSVIALLNEHQDVELWVSSTPKGLKDWFFDRVYDENFVSFYFPTNKYHPEWSMQMYNDFKNQLTDSGYKFEVLAQFSPSGIGVFQHPFITEAITDYSYKDQKPEPGWYYSIGVDWNDATNGTQIIVVGYNPRYKEEKTKPYRIVQQVGVSIERWTQLTAVREIVRLNRKWKAACIYSDYGHGSAANETLHERGVKAAPNSVDKRLVKTQVINFSSAIIVRDPWTKKKVKKPVKPYMVNNSVRIFENQFIEIPSEDEKLIKQLGGYIIDRVTPNGIPVYAADAKWGDHILDALILALLGFHMEFSTLIKPRVATSVNPIDAESMYPEKSIGSQIDEVTRNLINDKEQEREEFLFANQTASIYKPGDGMIRRTVAPRRFSGKRQQLRKRRF